ncbi:DUF5643 domain-containing protein [Paenibacillus peoriae]|uniref:DUF5643 domain-containing protein n=1 Tax=Paenibacillus peoriae TaxID=59893 RepID=UPI00096DA9F4|nr:DUF5643 domain-containing protein [Paenibacillus peoriae]OMF42905.1 hypothetical protein BK135_18665 [Paenibacillus peoriae]
MGDLDLNDKLENGKKRFKNINTITPYVRQRLETTYAKIETGSIQNSTIQKYEYYLKYLGLAFRIASIAVIIVFVVITSAFISPTMAQSLKQVSLLEGVFKLAGDLGLQTAEEKGLVLEPESNETHDRTKLKVSQVVFDGMRLALAVENDSKQTVSKLQDRIEDITLLINGKKIDYDGQSLSFYSGVSPNSIIVHYSDLSKNSKQGLPESFKLTVAIGLKGISKPFMLEVPVHKTTENTIVAIPGLPKSNDFARFEVEKVEATPITTVIYSTTKYISKGPITHGRESYGLVMNGLDISIEDDLGNELEPVGGNGRPGTKTRAKVMKSLFAPINSAAKAITIKPYLRKFNLDGTPAFDTKGNWKREYLPELETKISIVKK